MSKEAAGEPFSHDAASAQTTVADVSRHSCTRSEIAVAARRSRSTKVACAAPRDSASRPSAPLPAKRSRTRAPSMRGRSQLNRVSRTRSGVGRISTPAGNCSRRPRWRPPMMRRMREFAPALRAPPPASLALRSTPGSARSPTRRGTRLLPPFLTFANVFARAAWLATFWGPSVTYCPNITSSAHRSVRRGNATGLFFKNSEE